LQFTIPNFFNFFVIPPKISELKDSKFYFCPKLANSKILAQIFHDAWVFSAKYLGDAQYFIFINLCRLSGAELTDIALGTLLPSIEEQDFQSHIFETEEEDHFSNILICFKTFVKF
jgi:hypothetical protein